MICLVTDRRRLSSGADAADRVVELAGAAARAGVDVIHVRERDLEARDLVSLVRRCVRAASGTHARVVVNDRADVARAAGAHGVHLRSDSISAGAAKSLLPPEAIVGRSIHSAAEAAVMVREGAVDYLIFGTLFETSSKAPGHVVASVGDLAAVCRLAGAGRNGRVPVLAIGGMTLERAAVAARAGAAGVAAIGLFVPPAGADPDSHLRTIVASLRRTFDTCRPLS